MFIKLIFLLPCLACHQLTRFQGTPGLTYQRNVQDRALEYFDSVGSCAVLCRKLGDCVAYETLYIQDSPDAIQDTTFRGFRCSIPENGFTIIPASEESNSIMWQERTDKSPKRSVTTVAGTSPVECPTIWRQWTSDTHMQASGQQKWKVDSSSYDIGGKQKILDGLNTTYVKTMEESYPWIQVNLKRQYLITKVAILSGEEPLMNLEVRVGDSNLGGTGTSGNTRMTGNTKCGVFYGPTLVPQQWVEVDCGFSRGLKGQFITVQLTERFGGNYPLEIVDLEVYGWGRACGTEDPDP